MWPAAENSPLRKNINFTMIFASSIRRRLRDRTYENKKAPLPEGFLFWKIAADQQGLRCQVLIIHAVHGKTELSVLIFTGCQDNLLRKSLIKIITETFSVSSVTADVNTEDR